MWQVDHYSKQACIKINMHANMSKRKREKYQLCLNPLLLMVSYTGSLLELITKQRLPSSPFRKAHNVTKSCFPMSERSCSSLQWGYEFTRPKFEHHRVIITVHVINRDLNAADRLFSGIQQSDDVILDIFFFHGEPALVIFHITTCELLFKLKACCTLELGVVYVGHEAHQEGHSFHRTNLLLLVVICCCSL